MRNDLKDLATLSLVAPSELTAQANAEKALAEMLAAKALDAVKVSKVKAASKASTSLASQPVETAKVAAAKPVKVKLTPATPKVAAKAPKLTATALKKLSAKVKVPSKADKERADRDKRYARAKARAAKVTAAEPLLKSMVDAELDLIDIQHTLAAWMNITFAEVMENFGCHWTYFTEDNCVSDNEIAILAQRDEYERQVRTMVYARSPSARPGSWKKMCDASLEMYSPGAKPKSTKKAATLKVKGQRGLTALYRLTQNEKRKTAFDHDLAFGVGKLLIDLYHVDLSTLTK